MKLIGFLFDIFKGNWSKVVLLKIQKYKFLETIEKKVKIGEKNEV